MSTLLYIVVGMFIGDMFKNGHTEAGCAMCGCAFLFMCFHALYETLPD